ncbi:MAG: tetratricopeptide repeat protein [Pyrinomonadaceae bacterium]
MKSYKNIRTFLLHLFVFAALASFVATPLRAQISGEEDIAKVLELFKQKRFAEAAPYLEKIVKDSPNDPDFRFLYGFSLFIKAATQTDKTEARKLLAEARKQFVKAKELGSKEENLDQLIATIPPDGGAVSNAPTANYSKNKEAEELMNKGEAYFAGNDYDNAFLMYQEALKKDPNIYEAALYSGDVFVQKGDFDKAEVWYQKAILINPNRETAYRYSATPLMKQKKYDRARERYVEAYITEPYNSRALGGMKQWSEITGIEIGHPSIEIPVNVGAGNSGNINITQGGGDKTDDGSFAWTAYGMSRTLWQTGKNGLSDKFKTAFPNETKYRHSLAEEYDALKMTVTTLKERMKAKDNPVKKLHPDLAMLVEIYDKGFLEPYILLALKDEGIAQDHPAYLKQNRDKLREYVFNYVFSRPKANSVKADG